MPEPTPYPDYPHPEAEGVTLRPSGDGNWTGDLSMGAEGGEGGTGTVVDNFGFEGGHLAAADWSSHRLLYATPELAQDVHLSGVAKVRVRLAADRPAVNLSVWLVSPAVDEQSSGYTTTSSPAGGRTRGTRARAT